MQQVHSNTKIAEHQTGLNTTKGTSSLFTYFLNTSSIFWGCSLIFFPKKYPDATKKNGTASRSRPCVIKYFTSGLIPDNESQCITTMHKQKKNFRKSTDFNGFISINLL